MSIIINPINPVAFSVFGLPVRWYALAYIAGFVLGFWLFKRLAQRNDSEIKLSNKQLDDYLTCIVFGVILGGRLGYILFYNFSYYLAHPLEIFALWHGGMSFHGGVLGVIVASFIFAATQKLHDKSKLNNTLRLLDIISVVVPIGLFFGRIANFINMEVMGRVTQSSLGVIFVGESAYPRHPSPLYEAASEGLVLFIIMLFLYNKTKLRKYPGAIGGSLCMLYSVFRIFCEQFRQPDAQIGYLTSWGLTMGQLMSIIMFIVGALVFWFAVRKTKKKE